MMQRTVVLSLLAYAGGVSLRGDGVEEVSDQIEHFPPEDFNAYVDRRLLVDEDADARLMMEEYFDEWPDQEVVGNIVEIEEESYVDEYKLADGDEDTFDDIMPMDEGDDVWSDADIVGTVVKDEGKFSAHEKPTKEYTRDPNSVTLEDVDLLGNPTGDQYDRRETACADSKSEFMIMLATDEYAYETRWTLTNSQTNERLDFGPPTGSNYADNRLYSGRWCLTPGSWTFKMIDAGADGICDENPLYGCGNLKMYLDGAKISEMSNDTSDWSVKQFPFVVGISSRIDGVNTGGGNNNSWCRKVRSKYQVRRGTCKLANGNQGHRVRVTTKVDKYGKETSWKILKMDGTLKMKMDPIIEKFQTKSVERCLPAGKYKLIYTDLDGVCCRHGQGFFKLIVNGKELLNGGSFTKAIDHDFQLGFDWISTMSERDCEWFWAHDYRRRDWHTRCYEGQYCNKGFRNLKWSRALRADAQVYANTLLDTCDTVGIKHDKTDQGENLAKNKGSGRWGENYTADKVTKRFVDNEEFWGWNRNAHLTQAMWYPSRYIGCAESVKQMSFGRTCRMQVCRYAKAGNCMMGKYNSDQGDNWMKPMMMDDSPCGPMCASRDGCFH